VELFAQLAHVPRRPPRSDLVLTALLALWAVAEALPAPGPLPLELAFALVVTVPLAFRRRLPLLVLGVVAAALLVRTLTADGPPATVAPFPSILVATFSAALHVPSLPAALCGWGLAAGGMAAAEVLGFYGARPDPGSLAVLLFFVTGAWAAGRLLREREVQLREAEERTRERARRAVADERLRIARELHDVVAHSLSIIAVNAGAAGELSRVDPELARGHMDAVAETAREALAEMRHLLEALRAEDDDGLAPQPTLDRLPDLVEQARASGLAVELVERGERRGLTAGLELALYRVVQEALTNVRRHAGAVATRVELSYGEAEAAVEVRNEPGGAHPPDTGPGHGLAGMRERARLYGGTLEAGPTPEGGYAVRMRLPLETP